MSSPGGFGRILGLLAGGAHRVAIGGILEGLARRALGLFIGRFVPQADPEQRSLLIRFASQAVRAGQIQTALPPAARIRLADIPVNPALVHPGQPRDRYRYRVLTTYTDEETGQDYHRSHVVWSSRLLSNREIQATAQATINAADTTHYDANRRSIMIRFADIESSVQSIERSR